MVILLRPIEFKKMPSHQCHGQIIQIKGGERCKKVVYFPNNESNECFVVVLFYDHNKNYDNNLYQYSNYHRT